MNGNPTVVFTRPREVVIENRPQPEPQAGELLIRTRCSLVSTGTELTYLNGEFPPDSRWAQGAKFPLLVGYANVGDVIAVGPGGDASWLGKRVAGYGRHARYNCVPLTGAHPIHRDIPDEHAVFSTIAEIVMNGVRRAQVQWGETVVVYGLGLLGQLAARFCHLCGARPVIGVDVADSRLEKLPNARAFLALNANQKNVVAEVQRATRQRLADVVFEVTGNAQAIPGEFQVLRPQGRFVVLSGPRGKTTFDFHDLCTAPSFTIIGAHFESHPAHATRDNPWTRDRHAEFFFDLVADGELEIEPLISHCASYAEAPRLYQMLLADRTQAMGVILQWAL